MRGTKWILNVTDNVSCLWVCASYF